MGQSQLSCSLTVGPLRRKQFCSDRQSAPRGRLDAEPRWQASSSSSLAPGLHKECDEKSEVFCGPHR